MRAVMASAGVIRWTLLAILLGMVAACGRMLPMGGRDELIKYTVSKGETLYSISWRYGYDHREVAAWNNIKPPYNIYPGQQLYIIAPHQQYAKPSRQQAAASSSTSGTSTATPPAVVASAPAARSNTTPSSQVTSRPAAGVEKRPAGHQKKGIGWQWPTEGVIVGSFSPGNGKKGLDIRGKLGQSVIAAADGNVVYSGSGLIGYGNLVIIKHNDTYLSAYGHNRRLLVKEGAAVKQGEKIAEMGDSGKEGVILHFEIRRDGKPVNPLTYLPKRRN
jgi:lipoprotein NlpD